MANATVSSGAVRRTWATLGSGLFFVLAPGVVAGLIPWWLTRWQLQALLPLLLPFRFLGAVLVAAGAFCLIRAFVQFVVEGLGTPAPLAPTERLVVGGLYRYVRNPMYLAVLAVIVGQGLLFAQPVLFAYAALMALAFVAFVAVYEEPTLRERYGAAYDAYRREVPAWWPRLRRR